MDLQTFQKPRRNKEDNNSDNKNNNKNEMFTQMKTMMKKSAVIMIMMMTMTISHQCSAVQCSAATEMKGLKLDNQMRTHLSLEPWTLDLGII